MKTSIFAASVFALFILSSCSKTPEADITVEKHEVSVGENVGFKNYSLNAFSYEWDFGDGTTSTMEEPVHSYSDTGNYLVSLKAISENGKKEDVATSSLVVISKATVSDEQQKDLFIGSYLIDNGNGSSVDYYYLDIEENTSASNKLLFKNFHNGLFSSIDAKINNNHLTLETDSVLVMSGPNSTSTKIKAGYFTRDENGNLSFTYELQYDYNTFLYLNYTGDSIFMDFSENTKFSGIAYR